MECSDELLMSNCDWDPAYLRELVGVDFFEFEDLWSTGVNDMELLQEVKHVEDKYCPVVEDISIDDEVLCSGVEKIEEE